MHRYTDKQGHKKAMTSSVEAYKKLASYEDSGLSPEDIAELQEMFCSGHKGEIAGLGMDKARVHARQLVKFYEEKRMAKP